MKIASVVIFHKNPGSIARLIGAMNHPAFDFYLHLDKKVDIQKFSYLAEIPQTYFVSNRVPVRWAGFSQIEAFISAMDEIVDSNIQYDFVNLLSGQDYPIQPAEKIYEFLLQNKNKSFLICETPPTSWWDKAYSRYANYHFVDYGFPGKYRFGEFISKLFPKRKFPLPLTLYGGPQGAYWILSMEAAKYVHTMLKSSDYNNFFFKHTWGADEFLIHTLLMNSSLRNTIIPENYHYFSRARGDARPKILTVDDLPQLRSSNKFFARKFDPDVDSRILDLIDTELLLLKKEVVN